MSAMKMTHTDCLGLLLKFFVDFNNMKTVHKLSVAGEDITDGPLKDAFLKMIHSTEELRADLRRFDMTCPPSHIIHYAK